MLKLDNYNNYIDLIQQQIPVAAELHERKHLSIISFSLSSQSEDKQAGVQQQMKELENKVQILEEQLNTKKQEVCLIFLHIHLFLVTS